MNLKSFVVAAMLIVAFVWTASYLTKQKKSRMPQTETKMQKLVPTGLQKPWPEMSVPKDNPMTPEKVELGRLLFFDPVLSGDNKISCAHCHHPQKGLSDGGVNPKHTRRNPPTLYNVAYKKFLFVDGRANSLEAQAAGPITNKKEMNENPARLVKKLKNIPEYVRKFREAFKGEKNPVTFKNAVKAIASFERTLVSKNSAFDKYAAGDETVLTPQQIRGLNLYRSLKTQCFECHMLPTFDQMQFKVVGAPEKDAATGKALPKDFGVEEITGNTSLRRAFLVPTLRNIMLTAPYMHNGAFKTLEQVIVFYSKGAGDALGIKNTDERHIRKFDITKREIKDLIAFFGALTDISAEPVIPSEVPSKLPVVKTIRH